MIILIVSAIYLILFVVFIYLALRKTVFINEKNKKLIESSKNLVQNILGEEIFFSPTKFLDEDIFKDNPLFFGYDSIAGSNFVEGSLDDLKFASSFLRLESSVNQSKTTSWDTIFDGGLIVFYLNKNFDYEIYFEKIEIAFESKYFLNKKAYEEKTKNDLKVSTDKKFLYSKENPYYRDKENIIFLYEEDKKDIKNNYSKIFLELNLYLSKKFLRYKIYVTTSGEISIMTDKKSLFKFNEFSDEILTEEVYINKIKNDFYILEELVSIIKKIKEEI